MTSETTLTAADYDRSSSGVSFLESSPGMTRTVERAIARTPALAVAAKNVDVSVDRGVVALRGSVPDHATRDDLEAVVRGIPGVVFIQDDVVVSPMRDRDDEESDETIAFSIQRALHSDPDVRHDANTVSIDVVHGRVTLRGATSDPSTSASLERLVMDTPGVASVSNDLRVVHD